MRIVLAILLLLVTLSVRAQRIVSLMPSATQILVELGADEQVVGRTSYCPKSKYETKIVGDAMMVSMEGIVSLKPDVVIVSSFTRVNVRETLERLKIRTVLMSNPQDLNEICSQTIGLGRLANKEKEAQFLVSEELSAIATIISESVDLTDKRVYVQVGTNPVYGATPDYYLGDLVAKLGMVNVLQENEGMLAREQIIARKPDIIIISTMGGLGEEEAAKWRQATKAVTIVVDENKLCLPTPTFFKEVVAEIYSVMDQVY